jgi:hypothetical protein
MSLNGKAGFSIPEWCAAAGFSPALYYKRKRLGLPSPRETNVGRRTIITESPSEYLKRCSELEAAPGPAISEVA